MQRRSEGEIVAMEWILMQDRKPDENDADEWGCVIVWHLFNGAMITGWRNAVNGTYYSHWMHTPTPPINAEQQREEIEMRILGSKFRQ